MLPRVATLTAVSALVFALSASAALASPTAAASAAKTIYVWPGQSIQAAINKAPSGALISVERGTYRGSLEIKRSVRLVGQNAIIVPGTKDSVCLGDGAFTGPVGICAHGDIDPSTGAVRSRISNVAIEGFAIQGFGGPGIVVLGVDGFRAVRDVAAYNGETGMWINQVSDLYLMYNRAYRNGADGLYVESSPSSNAVITGNRSNDNLGAGIMFLNSLGGRIALNAVTGNCAGIVVASVAIFYPAPADPSGDVSIQLNQVTANNRPCPAVEHQTPAYGGVGIALIGARNTAISLNDVRDNREQIDSAIHGGGVVVLDGAIFGADVPTGNSISLNWLSGNTPYDIFGDDSGSANTVGHNTCTTTNLGGC